MLIRIRKILVEIKHNSKLLTYLWYAIRQPKYRVLERLKQNEASKRINGFNDERYIKLKSYENIHKGERCFIVATGPSLTISDLELIKDEVSFSMNSIVKLFKETDWRPTYYGIQDCNVYEKLEEDIIGVYKNSENVFISDSIAKKFDIPHCFKQFPLDAVYHDNQLELNKYFAKFSDDFYGIVYDGYSITYSLIELAVYMGFKNICLIGADCSYKRGEKNHIVDSGNIDKNEEKNHEKMIVGYKKAKEYADKEGIKIINCTRGGMLDVYERKTLEDVLDI